MQTFPNNVLTKPFKPRKLNAAILQLEFKMSPGEDDNHPEYLIRMGPKAKETMLTLFNKIQGNHADALQQNLGDKETMLTLYNKIWERGNGEDSPECNLQEEMEKTHLIWCPALKTRTESQRYIQEEMEKTHLIRCSSRGNGEDPPDSVSHSKDKDGKPEILGSN
ncbi:unnamed protein product [Rodentolepis nana]|uniref:Ubiquitin carboxyl-terminal hydrolase 14 n=1 Tax=Rodentolepis nana TaxID=102285 RepID=A0A0R3TNA5_RODNA|nr:unnamed protein product [Rodentolepis nana]